MRVALFRSKYGTVIPYEDHSWVHGQADYARISEYVDVEFPPLDAQTIVAGQVAQLDAQRSEVVEEFTKQLAVIDRRKAELISINYEPAQS